MLSRKAIIDIGTNSIKFCLAEGSGAGGYKVIKDVNDIVGLQPKRADVILAGACIVKAVLELTGAREMTVSDRSLRHGLLFQLFKA